MPPGPGFAGRYSHPTQPAVLQSVELTENRREVDLAGVRVIPVGTPATCTWPIGAKLPAQVADQVALDDLQVVDVELQLAAAGQSLDNRHGERQPIQEVAREVMRLIGSSVATMPCGASPVHAFAMLRS